jgi:membrane protease YdiL (CAAX protease family)
MDPPGFIRVFLLCFGTLAWFIFFEIVGNSSFNKQRHFAELTSVCGPLIFYWAYSLLDRRPLGFPPSRIPKYVLWSAVIIICAANALARHVTGSVGLPAIARTVVTCLAVGVGEELTFRGILFKAFQGCRAPTYLIVSSLLFASGHMGHGLIGMLFVLISGGAYGLARIAGMPLWMLMLIHACHDFLYTLPNTAFSTYHYETFFVAQTIVTIIICAYLVHPAHWRARLTPASPEPTEKEASQDGG